MNIILDNFHFIRPVYLLLIIPALILVFALYRLNSSSSTWSNYIDKNLLPYLLSTSASSASRFRTTLVSCILFVAIVALAGPTWIKKPVAVQKDQNALVIVWDLSPSMYASDIKPTRLERSKFKIIELLRQRKQGLTGLIVYSEDAHVVTPMTDDVNTIENLLGGLQPSVMPGYGSNVEMAQAEAIKLLADAGIQKGHILILTDGIDASAIDELASVQRKVPHRLSIWGVGTEEGAPIPLANGGFVKDRKGEIILPQLDNALMQEIAQKTGALYIPFSQDDLDINTIIGFALDRSDQNFSDTEREFDQWQEVGPYLLLPLLLLFPFLFRRGWLICALIFIPSLAPEKAMAFSFEDILLTKDQQAQKAFNEGKLNKAAETFENSDWKAASRYKSGQYDSAAALYAKQDDAHSAYNRGNALAKQRNYSEALTAYEQALALDPDHEKAKQNHKLIKEFLESQSQDSENSQNSEQQNSDQENQDQQSSDGQSQGDSEQKNEEQKNKNNSNGDPGSDNQNPEFENQDKPSDNKDNSESEKKKSEQSNPENSKSDKDQPSEKSSSDRLDQETKDKLNEKYQEKKLPEINKSKQEEQASATEQNEAQENSDKTTREAAIDPKTEAENREQFELERQLNKIPDNPGELLRRKFAQQRQERNMRGRTAPRRSAPNDEQRW